jgi:hypothetical protein
LVSRQKGLIRRMVVIPLSFSVCVCEISLLMYAYVPDFISGHTAVCI